jgi:hypothetical protein
MRGSLRVGGPGKVSLPRFILNRADRLSADTLGDRIRGICYVEGMAGIFTRSGIAVE